MSENGSAPLLTAKNLTVSFTTPRHGVVAAVRGIDLALGAGECLALVGESGSGKSATARAVLGLTGSRATVDAEELTFAGEQLLGFAERDWRRLRGARVGFVLQDALTSLDPLRLVGDEVAEPLVVHELGSRRDRDERVISLLQGVGIPDPRVRARQYPHELSGGLRQRALIASAIAASPSLVIADEPTTALDATVQRQVLDLLSDMRDAGTAILLISHDLSVVARLADRIAVMAAGVIVEQGTPDDILLRPAHPYTRELLAAVPTFGAPGRIFRAAADVDTSPRDSPTRPVAPSRADPSRPGRSHPIGRTILELDAVSKRFRSPDGTWRQAVDGVTFGLHAGEALGIVGESGSGKSTTAQIAMAMLAPDHGEVRLDGAAWSGLRERERQSERHRIQLISQDPLSAFDPRFTVERIIAEALGQPGRRGAIKARAEVTALLRRVGLDDDVLHRRGRELSGGQRQRVAIARAIAPRPEVLVCDEPVSALDVSVQARILALLAQLRHELGVALLFISHDLGVIHEVCDRVLVMKDGTVVEHGTVTEVLTAPRHPYTRSLLDSIAPDRSPSPASANTDQHDPALTYTGGNQL
ncbi:dipeptide ABC transporter ATP-binding protein [Acrocarpospora macrocephala]|uniref:dipeptide ABC transporter ATP-binding protein n=1 Tax=Acrocarpospora macrocephala TaxID=150177 RepID=UPI0012D3267F|nr:ABC transporter ATP-binding protein [Acrocarpospora macrocephala]